MTDFIYSQNMRVYGGYSPWRNFGQGQNLGYAQIFQQVGINVRANQGDVIIAAGFQEIRNPNCGNILLHLAQQLDPQLTVLQLIWIGRTALGWDEWLGIATAGGLLANVTYGVIMFGDDKQWHRNVPLNPAAPFTAIGQVDLSLDYRGVAYVSGTVGGVTLTIGFVHNVYRVGERTVLPAAMPKLITLLKQVTPNGNNPMIYVGGDFNVEPSDFAQRGTHRTGIAYAGYPALPTGVAVNTTVANCYDYFFSDQDIRPAAGQYLVRVFPATLVPNLLSDHSGVAIG